jgi:hypothetical protein
MFQSASGQYSSIRHTTLRGKAAVTGKGSLVFLLSLLLLASTATAQPKTRPAAKPAASTFQKLLRSTGLPANIINDSLAVIPYEGEHIPSYRVFVQRIGDLYVIHTNLSEALPGKIDETKFRFLLQQNNHYDIIKTGLDEENTAYVRADLYAVTVSSTLLTRVIKQVANVTNIMGGELSGGK